MKAPLVSVYITNYNYGAFIQQSIESLLAQSFQDFELLIIDDGSTDNSTEIIEQYRNLSRITIIYQQNKGLNVTNNIAMRAAQGKYLMRLDADDYLAPEALEKMSRALERNDQLGLVFPDYYYVDKDGNIIGQEKRHNFDTEVSLYDQPAHGACTMIRLDFLKAIGGYNESFTCQDGYDLWIKFVSHYKVSNINEPLFFYRQHGRNLTSNEQRILSARKKIKEAFVRQHYKTPNTIAIIPVRNNFIGGESWPLMIIDGKSILQKKVEMCLRAQRISEIVISTSDKEIIEHAEKWIDAYKRVILIKRPEAFAKPTESLTHTIQQVLQHMRTSQKNIEAIMTVSLEFPFITPDVLDDAVNTVTLFKSEALLAVRPDNRMYYQHTGHTLKPIVEQERFTRLEREAIYQSVGGIALGTVANFLKTKVLVSGSISHIVLDSKGSFSVFNEFDLEVFKALSKNEMAQA